MTRARLKPRVLVVDDEELPLRALCRRLSGMGYDVVAATSARAALEQLMDEPVDVVLTDIGMPDTDGLQLLRLLREHDARLPVVLITGAPEVQSAIRAIEYGAFQYLTKPSTPELIAEVLGKAARAHEVAQIRDDLNQLVARGEEEQAPLAVCFQRALASLWLEYQPVVTASREVFGYEIVLRTSEPPLAGAASLRRAALELGRSSALGRLLRHRIARALDTCNENSSVFVKVEVSDMTDPLLRNPEAALSRHADRVILEITAHAALEDMQTLRHSISELRKLGFRIAVDDLGAGYSALTTLALVEPDIAKVDASLVRDVHANATRQKLVRSLATLSRDVGMKLVAEGVETEDEHRALVELGCDLLQGGLYSRAAS